MENEVSKRLKEECDFLDEILKEANRVLKTGA